ncbi:nuclear protein DGCR14 [Tuber indicum]|nr:nuclear protein DGCR14 [Tuber indicum]
MASSSVSSKALTRKVDMELMPPPPPAKRIKRPPVVLDEDRYTDALSEIIARDFFPGLLETKHQQEYLDALDSHDTEWIREAGRKLTEVMTTPRIGRTRRGTSLATPTPRAFRELSATPTASSNPMAPSEDSGEKGVEKPVYEKHLSLDAFQSKYTSEDNASFNDLLDKQNQKKRSAYAFLWNDNRIPGFRTKAHQKRLKAQAESEEKAGGPTKSLAWKDDRKPFPNTWKAEPKNGLMFTPDLSPPPPPTLSSTDRELPPKAIAYSNTRMPAPQLPKLPSSPTRSVIRDAISGNPRPLPSESRFGAIETPRVNGYSFVDDAPSPSPSELGAPPLTWGSLASISDSTATPAPFKLAPTPKRELLHHRMVDRVAKGKRAPVNPLLSAATAATAAGGTGTTPRMTPLGGNGKGREIPTFKSTPRTALTPAGQRLLGNLKAGRGGNSGIFGANEGTPGNARSRFMPTPRAGKK